MKKKTKFTNRESLVEATMLALQGKLKLDEDVDVSVSNDGSTYIETDDATVIVQDKCADIPEEVVDAVPEEMPVNPTFEEPEEPMEIEKMEEPEEPEEPVETIEIPVEGNETVLPEEIMEESKKVTESDEDEDIEAETGAEAEAEESEEAPIDELAITDEETEQESEEVKPEEVKEAAEEVAEEIVQKVAEETAEEIVNTVEETIVDEQPVEELPEEMEEPIETSEESSEESSIDDIDLKESKKVTEGAERKASEKLLEMIDNNLLDVKNIVLDCIKYMSEDDIADMCNTNGYFDNDDWLEESKESCKDCKDCKEKLKVSSKTFNEALTKYYKTRYAKAESFKTNRILSNSTSLKVEGKLYNTSNISKDIAVTFKKVQEGNTFIKYEMIETNGLLKESKDMTTKLNMMTIKKNNVLECRYLKRK